MLRSSFVIFLSALLSGLALSALVTIVDLTHELHEDVPHHHFYKPIVRNASVIGNYEEHGYSFQVEEICLPVHIGTHIDAPYHSNSSAWGTTDIPLERLVLVPAAVVDIHHKIFPSPTNDSSHDSGQTDSRVQSDAELTVDDLEQWETINGRIPENSIVLIHTGWDRYWSDSNAYLGGSTPQNMHHPGLNPRAAEWIIRERPTVYGVGIDVVSLDYGQSLNYTSHRVLSSANVFILENLTNLGHLPPTGAFLYVGAVKIGRRASGAPVRVVATIYRNE